MKRLHQFRGNRGRGLVPQLETLESRFCLNAGVVIHGNTMIVLGDMAANTMAITDDGHGGVSATVTGLNGTTSGSGTGIRRITVDAGAGDDIVSYALTGALTTPRALQIRLGRGADKADLDFSPGVSGTGLKVDLGGGYGSDQVTARFGEINNANLLFGANLGIGSSDKLDATLAGNLVGNARALLLVRGGPGQDEVNIHADAVDIGAAAMLGIDLDGLLGADSLTVNYRGLMDGKLGIVAGGGAGKDTVVANVTANAGSTGSLGVGVHGGMNDDNLTLNVIDNSGSGGASTLSALDAVLNGGPGWDTCVHTANVTVKNCEA